MLMNNVCLKREHICIKLSLNDVNIIFLKQWSMPTIDFSINDDDDGGKDCKYGILTKLWWKYDGDLDAIDDDNDIDDGLIANMKQCHNVSEMIMAGFCHLQIPTTLHLIITAINALISLESTVRPNCSVSFCVI